MKYPMPYSIALYLIERVLEYGYYPDGMVAAVHEIHQRAPKTLVVHLTSSMKSPDSWHEVVCARPLHA
jgi:hypothetical protein